MGRGGDGGSPFGHPRGLHRARAAPSAAESVYTAAITATDEALARAPDYVMALGNKGEQLRKFAELQLDRSRDRANPPACQRLREAKLLLDRALTLTPNDPWITAESTRIEGPLCAHFPPP